MDICNHIFPLYRQGTIQIVAVNLQRVIEARAIVLMGDVGGEFEKLIIVEVLLERGKQFVADVYRCGGHLVGIMKQQLFGFGKAFVAKAGDGCDFGIGKAGFSAHGRAYIHSKLAAYTCSRS